MVEIKNNNSSLQLKIVNYQFPETNDKDYDGNWLLVEIRVNIDDLNWKKTDPSLLTWEFNEISEWFYNLSKDINPKWKELVFIEPNIRFDYDKNDKKTVVIIYFDLELLPDNWDKNKECFIKFELTKEDLYNIGKMFEEELNKFPIRK
ncbi:MAG TPA: hypothetical protein PK385_00645 [Spirochaetota bacterium]|nr:hypothetical protein [Spirochaetota bacterium]HOS31749.1 hypothetical protein [Spirochaetota bacterium]HOS54545.1 hypothetical protein [Spirochaetota bacterium]HPK60813.1 hypothetical protein [Spirochaetota bacterium]HQF77187.1 hypothetical protein [Spirochaetota bacterium]